MASNALVMPSHFGRKCKNKSLKARLNQLSTSILDAAFGRKNGLFSRNLIPLAVVGTMALTAPAAHAQIVFNGGLVWTAGSSAGTGSQTATIAFSNVTANLTVSTDTGLFRNTSNTTFIAANETTAGQGIYTIDSDVSLNDPQIYIGSLGTNNSQPLIGNFTLTLADGTVINNAAFEIIDRNGEFSLGGADTELATIITVGGNQYLTDPTNNGGSNQATALIRFTDLIVSGDVFDPNNAVTQITFENIGDGIGPTFLFGLTAVDVVTAEDSDFTAAPVLAGGTTPSVFANDGIDGAALISSTVDVSLTDTGGLAGVTINPDGTINIPEGSTPGDYTLTYEICEAGSTTNCSTATVTLTVGAAPSLSMTKVADNTGPHTAGDVVTYTYTVVNDGDQIIRNVAITDTHNGSDPAPVPGNETLLTDAVPTGDSTDAAVDGSWDVLAPGDTLTFTGTYTITAIDAATL